tara:strand:+ start:151 stop:369 length:219 start_codon:yes stop_codon:yes gene_type:complete
MGVIVKPGSDVALHKNSISESPLDRVETIVPDIENLKSDDLAGSTVDDEIPDLKLSILKPSPGDAMSFLLKK